MMSNHGGSGVSPLFSLQRRILLEMTIIPAEVQMKSCLPQEVSGIMGWRSTNGSFTGMYCLLSLLSVDSAVQECLPMPNAFTYAFLCRQQPSASTGK
jgi:hypothetical protein